MVRAESHERRNEESVQKFAQGTSKEETAWELKQGQRMYCCLPQYGATDWIQWLEKILWTIENPFLIEGYLITPFLLP